MYSARSVVFCLSSRALGVREVVLCKNKDGKVGVSFKAIDKGIFVSFVWRDSPAALVGLRFGDQILQINDEHVAGWSSDKALQFLKKAEGSRIKMIVRDRPFDRTVTLVKDSNDIVCMLVLECCVFLMVPL